MPPTITAQASTQQPIEYWVLLRGLGREAGHWGQFVALLQQALGQQHVVITLDLPGNGEFHRQLSPLHLDGFTAHLRQQLSDKSIRQPIHLVAISLGGMVAQHWAAQHPEQVKSLSLINSSFSRLNPVWQRLRPNSWPILVKGLFQNIENREQAIFSLTSNRPDLEQATLKHWITLAAAHPVRGLNIIRQLIAAARFKAKPFEPGKTLVLASIFDRMVSYHCSQRIAAFNGCEIRSHQTAGHDLPLDAPEWLAEQLISKWL